LVNPSHGTTEVDARTRRAVRFVYPTDVRLWNEDDLVAQFAQRHPVYRHYQHTRDGSAHVLTDFVGLRRWRRGPLYNEMYRPRRIEHQMSVSFSPTPGRTVGAMLNRERDFNDRDRLALNLLRPHLVEIYRRLETSARIRGELAHAHSAIEHVPSGVVVVGAMVGSRSPTPVHGARSRPSSTNGRPRRACCPTRSRDGFASTVKGAETSRGRGKPSSSPVGTSGSPFG
jgi:hypothetical protein